MRAKNIAVASAAGLASVALALGATGIATAADGTGSLGSLTGSLGGSADADQCGVTAVTPDDLVALGDSEPEADVPLGTWFTPGDENPATIIDATEDDHGTGVLGFEPNGDGTSLYQRVDLGLDDLTGKDAISYTFTAGNGEGANTNTPALQIRVLGANTAEAADGGNGFATIVWSPQASDGAWGVATPDANVAQFWVTRDIVDAEGHTVIAKGPGNLTTLTEIAGKNPDANVYAVGVQQTRENQAEDVKVDTFTLNCATTDFELDADSEPAGSLAAIFGSLGSLGSQE